MGLIKKLIFILSICVFSHSYAMKNIIDEVSEIKKEYKKLLQENPNLKVTFVNEDPEYSDIGLCVSCDDILALTNDINNILKNTPANGQNIEELALESANLEAVYEITKSSHKKMKINCTRIDNDKITDEFSTFDQNKLILIAEKTAMNKFRSAQFRSSREKVIWLRGREKDSDKIVRVYLTPSGEIQISYYRMENKPGHFPITYKKNSPKKDYHLPEMNSSTKPRSAKEDESSGNYSLKYGDQWSTKDGEESYDVNLGLDLEYASYLPKKLTLINIGTQTPLGDNITLASKTIVSDKEQSTQIVLGNKSKTARAGMKIHAERIDLKAAYNLDITRDYTVNTSIDYKTTGTTNYSSSLQRNGVDILEAGYSSDQTSGELYKLEHRRTFQNNGVMSIKLEKRGHSQNSSDDGKTFWLSYKMEI